MVTQQILAVAALVSCAQAAPVRASTTHIANFTVPGSDVEGTWGDPVTLPGLYEGLYYSIFEIYQSPFVDYPDTGVFSHSLVYGAAFGTGPQSFNAAPASTIDEASVSINYQNSKTASFTLSDFWWGCTVGNTTQAPDQAEPNDVQNPANCTITVKGYRSTKSKMPSATETPDVTATFEYVPASTADAFVSGAYVAPMDQAILPSSFTGLKTVTFAVSNNTEHSDPESNSTYSAPAAYLDDLHYTLLSS